MSNEREQIKFSNLTTEKVRFVPSKRTDIKTSNGMSVWFDATAVMSG